MLCDLNNIQGPQEAGDEKWEEKAYCSERETGWETSRARWKKRACYKTAYEVPELKIPEKQ